MIKIKEIIFYTVTIPFLAVITIFGAGALLGTLLYVSIKDEPDWLNLILIACAFELTYLVLIDFVIRNL